MDPKILVLAARIRKLIERVSEERCISEDDARLLNKMEREYDKMCAGGMQ